LHTLLFLDFEIDNTDTVNLTTQVMTRAKAVVGRR
jgi:hypothetical protein